jgi:hypothetical protein
MTNNRKSKVDRIGRTKTLRMAVGGERGGREREEEVRGRGEREM